MTKSQATLCYEQWWNTPAQEDPHVIGARALLRLPRPAAQWPGPLPGARHRAAPDPERPIGADVEGLTNWSHSPVPAPLRYRWDPGAVIEAARGLRGSRPAGVAAVGVEVYGLVYKGKAYLDIFPAHSLMQAAALSDRSPWFYWQTAQD